MHQPSPSRRLLSLTLAVAAGAAGLAGCLNPPAAAPDSGRPAQPAPSPPVGAPGTAAPAPRAAPPQAPADGPAPGSPAAQQLAQRGVSAAIDLLEAGSEEQAVVELNRALEADPGNKLAQSLLKQVQTDPVALLGREHFVYRVQPGESLSRIAQRFLGDVHLFYALARYNDIRVPRQLQGGQAIRVPGRAPAPTPSPPPASTAPAVAPSPPPPAAAPAPPAAPKAADDRAAEAEKRSKIAAATRAARSAYARQDLDGAIRHWDTVLELDPGNSTAQLERRRALNLKERLERLPKGK